MYLFLTTHFQTYKKQLCRLELVIRAAYRYYFRGFIFENEKTKKNKTKIWSEYVNFF